MPLEVFRLKWAGKRVAVVQRCAKMRGGLPMSAEPRRFLGCQGSIFEHRGRIISQRRVMHELRRICVVLFQCLQHAPVHFAAPLRGHRAIDGEAREFMSETHSIAVRRQQAARDALIDCRPVRTEHRSDEPAFGFSRRDGHQFGQIPRRRRAAHQSSKNCVAHGLRNPLPGTREGFGHEEWISAGDLVQQRGIPAAVLGHLADGHGRKRREPHADDMPPRKFTQRESKRMNGRQLLIAVGCDEQCASALNAPADEAEKVERRFVGPVHILEHHDRRGLRRHELCEQGAEEPIARFIGRCGAAVEDRGLRRDFMHGSERSRRIKRIARAP